MMVNVCRASYGHIRQKKNPLTMTLKSAGVALIFAQPKITVQGGISGDMAPLLHCGEKNAVSPVIRQGLMLDTIPEQNLLYLVVLLYSPAVRVMSDVLNN